MRCERKYSLKKSLHCSKFSQKKILLSCYFLWRSVDLRFKRVSRVAETKAMKIMSSI